LGKYGLRIRIVAIITVLTLTLVFLIGIVMLKIAERNLLKFKTDSGKVVLNSLQTTFDTFWQGKVRLVSDNSDIALINLLAKEMEYNIGIYGLKIVDRNKRIIAAGKPTTLGAFLDDNDILKVFSSGKTQVNYIGEKDSLGIGLYNKIIFTGPIYLNGEVKAVVRFSMFSNDVNKSLTDTLKMLYLYAFLDMILVLLIGGLVLMHYILRPLNAIRRATAKIIQGDLEHPIPILANDEIGLLTKDLEELRAGLLEKDQTVKKQMASMETLNKSLTRIRDQLIHTDRLAYVGRVSAGVAHEIGNALSSIYGYLDVIKSGYDDKAVLEDVTRRLSLEVERIDGIMRELLTFSRPQKETKGPVNIPRLILECMGILKTQRVLDNMEINFSADNRTPYVMAEVGQLKQVVINLIVNAADAMGQKGRIDIDIIHGGYDNLMAHAPLLEQEPDLETGETAFMDIEKRGIVFSSRIPYTDQEQIVMLNIRDFGPGIEPKNLGSIFEPFFTTKGKAKGTGLGLSICQRIVEGMGGLLRVQSRMGTGTVVTCFFLPGRKEDEINEDI